MDAHQDQSPDRERRPKLSPLMALWLAALLMSTCGASTARDAGPLLDAVAALDLEPTEAATCDVLVQNPPNGGHAHTASDCDPVTYASNPPSSGTHYPDWTAYKTYAAPVPWGFLVHDLEHGAIVIVYNCPEGCPAEVAQAQAFIDALPPDKGCAGAPMKIVLAPDPSLDVRWAAAAWTWTLRASCFDSAAFAGFVADHYQGPDTEGACPGDLDRSASGWCP